LLEEFSSRIGIGRETLESEPTNAGPTRSGVAILMFGNLIETSFPRLCGLAAVSRWLIVQQMSSVSW
jgi:hypothetical protein